MAQLTYILCPGQGAQVVGMGKDFYELSSAAREIFDTADRVLGFDIKSLCFAGPQLRLSQTDISQPAIYTTTIAAFRAGVEAGKLDVSDVATYAGLSLGEYTALHLAGVFSFEQGLKLVSARGRFMQEAATASPSGMVAIMGADEPAIEKLCADCAAGEVLVPANFNAPGQVVVSGSKAACARVVLAAEAAGLKAVTLDVAGAFHSPMMQSGADKMQIELHHAVMQAPKVPVYSNVTAEYHGDVDSIRNLLVRQIVSPVRWEQTMKKLLADGDAARYIEPAPGRTLAGLAKRINRRLPIESWATADVLKPVNAAAKAN